MVKWSVSYAQAEATLAKLHGASAVVQQKALRGRLKHLKRLGIPRGINPGRGAKIYYHEEHVFEWAFCLELAEFGLDPSLIVRLINETWEDDILPKFMKPALPPSEDDLYFVAAPGVMRAAWDGAAVALPFKWYKQSKIKTVPYRLPRRAILINVSELGREIALAGVMYHSTKKSDEGE